MVDEIIHVEFPSCEGIKPLDFNSNRFKTSSSLYPDSPLSYKKISHISIENQNQHPATFNIVGSSLIFKMFQEIEDHKNLSNVDESNLGYVETKNNEIVLKISPKLQKKLDERGISDVAMQTSKGLSKISSVSFKQLSDNELRNLRIAAKTYIVFLQKMKEEKKEEKNSNDDLFKKLESLSKYLDLEIARRSGEDEKISASIDYILSGDIYRTSDKIFHLNLLDEAREKELLQKEEILADEIKFTAIRTEILKTEINFQDLKYSTNNETAIKQDVSNIGNKNWVHMSYFINLRKTV